MANKEEQADMYEPEIREAVGSKIAHAYVGTSGLEKAD